MGKWTTKIERDCELCGKRFIPNSNSQKYCADCRNRKCCQCGKDFIINRGLTKNRKGKYCSKKCFLLARWKIDKCKFCGKPAKYTYCSDNCRKRYWDRNEYTLLEKKKRWWKEKKKFIELLGEHCSKCGTSDIRVLEIHHKDRDKKKRYIQGANSNSRRLLDWKEGKDNIELLCANCHRIITWEQMGYGKE